MSILSVWPDISLPLVVESSSPLMPCGNLLCWSDHRCSVFKERAKTILENMHGSLPELCVVLWWLGSCPWWQHWQQDILSEVTWFTTGKTSNMKFSQIQVLLSWSGKHHWNVWVQALESRFKKTKTKQTRCSGMSLKCNPWAGREADPVGSLSSEPSLLGKFQALSQNKGWVSPKG